MHIVALPSCMQTLAAQHSRSCVDDCTTVMVPESSRPYAGEADVHYGHNTNPYLLSHLRPSAAAQRAAAQAAASLPAPLRPIADFYSSSDTDRRQEALDTLLQLLQGPLQQQYAGMWDPDAISVFVIKVSDRCCPDAWLHPSCTAVNVE